MKLSDYVKEKQPETYNKLNKKKRKKKERKERLSFSYIEKLMSEGHVYKRHKGAFRQVK